jgi:integrase/recombinase XerD
MNFSDYLAAELGAAPATIEAYGRNVRWAEDFLGKPLDVATLDDLRSVIRHSTSRGDSAATSHQRSASLRTWLRFAEREADREQLDCPRPPQRLPGLLPSNIEIGKMIGAAAQNLRDTAIIELLYASGLRATELL